MSEEEKEITEEVEEEIEEQEEETEESEESGDKEKPKEEKPARFELAQSEVPVAQDDTIEITHNGRPYRLPKDEIIKLAQKGFDYDVKVGPHGKLVQMVDADPELAKTIDNYWKKKVAGEPEDFKIKPITEYEDETEWLQDNLRQALKTVKPQATPTPQPAGRAIENALKMRDPETAHLIIPQLGKYVSQLSVSDYQKVDSDMGALCQFYDFVKTQEMAKRRTASPTETKHPGFRVKSGGGDAPKENSTPVWKLSKEEFQKQLDKVKGLSFG